MDMDMDTAGHANIAKYPARPSCVVCIERGRAENYSTR